MHFSQKYRDRALLTTLAVILVVAARVPALIVPGIVRTEALVVDVGIKRMLDQSIIGGVDFEGVRRKAAFITPLQGGFGPP